MKELASELPSHAKKAAGLMGDVLDELSGLLVKLRPHVPAKVALKVDDWLAMVARIRASIDNMFKEAAEHLKKKLDEAIAALKKEEFEVEVPTQKKATVVQETTPPPSTARKASAAGKAIVRSDLRKPTQELLDAGPNRWVDLPNKPEGAYDFQRGLSGDYATGLGGKGEAESLLSGANSSTDRFVSVLGDRDSAATMDQITRQYADPIAIKGKADLFDVTGDMGSIKNLNADNISSMGAFTPSSSETAMQWGRNYLGMADDLAKEGIVPTPGSRGAAFVEDLKGAFGTAKYGEFDGIGRPVINRDEVQGAVSGVMDRYK
jgi:hypothetical protein